MIHSEQDYQATFVYNHDDGSYYSLYVHDAQQAQGLYNSIQNEIDPVTNDFKIDGKCDRLLNSNKKVYRGLSTEQQQIYRLCIIIAEHGGNGIAVTKYNPTNKRTEVYSVDVQTGSDGKKTYIPLICK